MMTIAYVMLASGGVPTIGNASTFCAHVRRSVLPSLFILPCPFWQLVLTSIKKLGSGSSFMQHQESSAMHEMMLRKGSWLEEEDEMLATAVAVLGDKRWDSLAKASGLNFDNSCMN